MLIARSELQVPVRCSDTSTGTGIARQQAGCDFAKGNSPYAQFRNEKDWNGFRSCRECHLEDSPRPIILWRVLGVTRDQPLVGVTDDNADGKLEVNRPEETLLYIEVLVVGNAHVTQSWHHGDCVRVRYV